MRRAWISPLAAATCLELICALMACSGAPQRAPVSDSAPPAAPRRDVVDECEPELGGAPQPLARVYDGLARGARCERELQSIMTAVTRALGVQCSYCHLPNDYSAPTRQKEVANWMARELVPRLAKKSDGSAVWCNDCHATRGRGVAKILGSPRSEARAIEWMTVHLANDFERIDGERLRCASCHGAALGAPDFERKLILSDRLGALPSRGLPSPPAPIHAGPSGAAGAPP